MIKDKKLLRDIADFAKTLHSQENLNDAIVLIADKARELLWVDRCSVFIYNRKHDVLWTTHSHGLNCLVLPVHRGVVGKTFIYKKPNIVNDASTEKSFFTQVDENTGYQTKNMATVPIFDLEGKILGVFQVINKVDGDFTKQDLVLLEFFARYISNYLSIAVALDEQEVLEKYLKNNKEVLIDLQNDKET